MNSDFSKCCMTCKSWGGDVQKQKKMIETTGEICMCVNTGWPECGECASVSSWGTLQIHGNATASLIVEANFGCNRHKSNEL